jgi:hypothetical protein
MKMMPRKSSDRRQWEVGLPGGSKHDRRRIPERRPITVRETTLEEFETAMMEQALRRLREKG